MTLKLSAEEVKLLAGLNGRHPPCKSCAVFASEGWESFPSLASEAALTQVGALWVAGEDEPTLDEYHPDGTSYWSPFAPIALGFHPYNRCELWQCCQCAHPFLRYTEYGGYYEDRRIRNLNPELIA